MVHGETFRRRDAGIGLDLGGTQVRHKRWLRHDPLGIPNSGPVQCEGGDRSG